MNENGEHAGGITGFLKSIGAAIRMHHPTRCVIAFDGKGGSQRRRKLFPEYKGQRRMMTSLNRTYEFSSIEQEKESMAWQLQVLFSMLGDLPVTVLNPENVEADDVLAYLAQLVVERGGKSVIMSTDKDFLQLVSEDITMWNSAKKKTYTPALVVEDYGFHPNNFLMYRVVTGDNSDNIDGVYGIKEKTLLKYFPEMATEECVSIELLLAKVDGLLAEAKKAPVALKALSESKAILLRNEELMRLDDVAMSGITRINILDKFDGPLNKLNKYQLTTKMAEVKIIHAFSSWDTWVVSTFGSLNMYAGLHNEK
jgi:DNA polymerase-1